MDSTRFLTVAFTAPRTVEDETAKIMALLQGGVDFIHIRKPKWTAEMTGELIASINEEFHSRLKLHDHFELTRKFNLGGVHLNRRNPEAPKDTGNLSCSLHSIAEIANLKDAQRFSYVTLSPIFDSISKPGYKSLFDETVLSTSLPKQLRVIALGGVTPDKYDFLKKNGFSGAGLLGYIWESPFEDVLERITKEITK